MTCFSIHKKFRILIAVLLIGGIGCGYAITASAGNTTPAEEATEEEDLGVSAIPKATSATSTLSKKESRRVEAPIVVELYTASDCTACVFADRMLYDASQEKNVIALSCHIRDLDELEKNNEAKDKSNAAVNAGPVDPCVFRQWTYSAYSGNKEGIALNVPTFIMNGGDKVTADNLAFFTGALNSYRYAPKNKTIEALVRWKDGDTLSIMLPEAIQTKVKVKINASVWLVRYKDMEVEKINDGVNKGRVLRFSNIIQDIKHIGKWHGMERSIEYDVPPPQGGNERGGYAVLVGEMLGERIMVAGKVSDYATANDQKKTQPATP